jgi:predicted transcriptional regulator
VSHPNARLTVRGRLLIVERAQAGWKQAHIAAAMGISRRCVRRWLDRYRTEGEAGLHDRSSRPHHSPGRMAPALEAAVLALRERERLGRDAIADRLGLSARSVSRSSPATGSRISPVSTPSPGSCCGPPRRPRSVMNEPAPVSSCTWM